MSTGTMTRNRIGMTVEMDAHRKPSERLEFGPAEEDTGTDIWPKFSQTVIESAEQWLKEGLQKGRTSREEETAVKPARGITVAPGIVVTPSEYAERYGSLDLDRLRNSMTPEVFKAFVRHIGAVTGREDLDVDLMSDIPG